MNKPKRIKISKIENKIQDVSCKLSRIDSMAKILYECLHENYNLTDQDSQSFCLVLCEEIKRTKNKLNKIELILNI